MPRRRRRRDRARHHVGRARGKHHHRARPEGPAPQALDQRHGDVRRVGVAADVVAAWPGFFRAPDGCANASAGLRVAVGTGRGADGRLRLGDVSWDYSSL